MIRTLQVHRIEWTALQSLMLGEVPRFFMHVWANDDATILARGLGAALDRGQLAPRHP